MIATITGPLVTAGAQRLTPEDFGSRWPQEAAATAQQIPPVTAQQIPPTTEERAAPPPKTRQASGPAMAGTWSGTVTQVSAVSGAGSQSKYTVALSITAKGGETDYPELGCGGKLTRIGASRSYVFFVETITRGQVDKGGRCPDGTITVTPAGEKSRLGMVRRCSR